MLMAIVFSVSENLCHRRLDDCEDLIECLKEREMFLEKAKLDLLPHSSSKVSCNNRAVIC